MKQRPSAEDHQLTHSTKSFDQEGPSDHTQSKDETTKKGPISSMLSEMLYSITRGFPMTPSKIRRALTLQSNERSLIEDPKYGGDTNQSPPQRECLSDSQQEENSSRKKSSSIVSMYCKKSDITFVSSSDEFALKMFSGERQQELQIEMVISRKNTQDTTAIEPYNKQVPTLEEQDDDGFELLESNHSNSKYDQQLQFAIYKHSSILKAFEIASQTSTSAKEFIKTAHDLFLSLQQSLLLF